MVERYIEVTDEYVKQLEQEIDNLKKINEKHKKLNGELREENKKQKEVIEKAIYHLDFFISDTNLSKYDTLKILMHAKKILKGVDKEVE